MKLLPVYPFPELQSGNLLLREVLPEDIPDLLEILTYDGKAVETPEEGMQIMKRIHQDYLDGNSVNWGIQKCDTGELMGVIGYYRGFAGGSGEVGFILKAAFRGFGYLSSSLSLVLAFGLEQLKLNEIKAYTKPDNAKAIATLSRNGFVTNQERDGDYWKFVYSPE